jgi:beta-mannanase
MKIIHPYVWLLITSLNCTSEKGNTQVLPADKNATAETVSLYNNLPKLASKGFMFGHQDDLAYGVEWKYKPGRSDVKDVTDDYPAVYGWEIGGIERENNPVNLDSVPFTKMTQFIKEAYARGAVITLSWHTDSPFSSPSGAWDTTHGAIASILPGAVNHDLYKSWLDKAANFIYTLKGSRGEAIPILFRPFHEHTGSWFWWGKNGNTTEEYKALWRFTIGYLQDQKKLHNLLWVYNTSGDFNSREEFLDRYPGDDVVDLLSFDAYQHGDPKTDKSFEVNTNKKLSIVAEIASSKNKPFAIGETGYEAIPDANWWTGTLMNVIGKNKISYVLLWRNHGFHQQMKRMHYYVPYKGQASADDFLKFYELPVTLFEKDIRDARIYQ